jgi:Tfp pilus assembly protein PilF
MRDKARLNLIHAVIIALFFGMLSFGQEDLAREEAELFKKYKSLNKNFEKGKMYFARKDYTKAKKEFTKILEKLPEHADAIFFLARIFYVEGNLDEALSYIQYAKDNYEFSAKMKIKMAEVGRQNLEEKKKDLEEYLGALEEKLISLPQESDEVEAEAMKKNLQTKMDELKVQIENINVELNLPLPTEDEIPAEYYYLRGNIYFKLKKFQEAHDQYQDAIKIDPSHGDSYNNLAALYFQVKQYQKAMDYLTQAKENGAKINPEFKKAVLKALGKD